MIIPPSFPSKGGGLANAALPSTTTFKKLRATNLPRWRGLGGGHPPLRGGLGGFWTHSYGMPLLWNILFLPSDTFLRNVTENANNHKKSIKSHENHSSDKKENNIKTS